VTRRDKNGSVRRPARLFLALLCALSLLSVSAEAAEGAAQQTVKVAVLNNTLYADRGDDGTWRGIDVECMIGIAQKAGFDLEFVDSSSDPDFLGSLDRGVYDVVADVVRTPEREAGYLFTDEAIGETRCTLAVRAADDRWDYGNIEQVSQMKIGVVRSYAINADFRSWCAKHTVTPVIMEYPDVAAMSAALLGGEIDGEVYSAVYDGDGTGTLRTIMKFLPESFYYAFRKDDTALKNAVDDALAQILIGNPDYLSGLRSKYEDQYRTNDLPFSAAEQRYIAAHPLLTVAVISGDAPYYKKSGGADAGVIPDYFALLAADTGFSFRYAAYASQAEAVAAVKSGAADLVGIFSGGVIAAQASGVALTDSFATVESLLMTRAGTAVTAIDRIAVRNRSVEALKDSIARAFPKAGLQTYESAQACFSALKHRRADAVVIGLPSATWLVNQTSASAYSLTPVPGASSELRAAVRGDSQLLCSILNKRIGVTKNRFPGLVTRDTLPADDWQTVIARTPSGWLAAVIAALLALVLGLTWSLRQLRRRQRERTAVLAAQAETERAEAAGRGDPAQRRGAQPVFRQHQPRHAHARSTPSSTLRPSGAPGGPAAGAADPLSGPSGVLRQAAARSDQRHADRLQGSAADKLELQPQPCRVRGLVEAVASPIREAAEKEDHLRLDLSQGAGAGRSSPTG
jgi:ABC-type amino acid transport substrate-binding protein